MMQGSTVYQRTEQGRAEIRNKSHGLTQSERQALILVDGSTARDALGQKLIRLSPQRLQQILLKLEQLGLISELLLAPEVQPTENFDSAEIERFLHQDALDPVTVISFEPEQDFDLTDPGLTAATNTLPSININSWVAQRAAPPQPEAAPEPEAARVDFYLPLGEAQEASADPLPASPISNRAALPAKQSADADRKLSWEYWFIGIGVLFIMLSLLTRYLR